ncbi:prepilin-type N-terminal cleavage/methylation domain-containing protein [Clostridium sp. 3-3]|uniref:prepilin-type N-terminal cleavage/methylation domain-containing protein n=1 Tax=Clostridium sp. 3-3 TaxID=2070757 RepID=UPI00241CEF01|nr:prepilin-type N-terminal cleavage/methylation domain-containing protein [Clostridium sp. 3-3]
MNQLVLKKKNELMKKKKGFTLVELIIVIAIIAILAAMAIPKFSSVRVDAKVSNDAAAAKNIQSQIAIEVANNNIAVPTTNPTVTTAVDDSILEKLDGKVGNTKKAEAISTATFKYQVMKNGDIKVFVNDGKKDYQLAPEIDTADGRKGYAQAAATANK